MPRPRSYSFAVALRVVVVSLPDDEIESGSMPTE
jgi:hypothetical protein